MARLPLTLDDAKEALDRIVEIFPSSDKEFVELIVELANKAGEGDEIRDAAERVLSTGGDWLGDMTDQAADNPDASNFMSAMEALRGALTSVIETAPDSKKTKGRATFTVDEDVLKSLDAMALANSLSRSAMVERALKADLGEETPQERKRWFERGFDKADPPELPWASTPEQRADPRFEPIFQTLKRWDIDADGKGYCGGNGSHVAALMNAMDAGKDPRSELHVAFDKFLDRWLREPPLCRASAGMHFVKYLEVTMGRMVKDIAHEETRGLHRRAKVTGRIMVCNGRLADLAIALTKHADAEAEDMGIEADVRYLGCINPIDFFNARQVGITEDRWAHVSVDVAKTAAKNLAEDMDKAIADDIEKSTEDGHGGPEIFDRGDGEEEMPPEVPEAKDVHHPFTLGQNVALCEICENDEDHELHNEG